MTLIKKSDVKRHTSTGSRESRQTKRPYGAVPTPIKSEPKAPSVEAKPKTPTAEREK